MSHPDPYLNKLLDAYFDGELDPAAKEDLERLIVSSQGARKAFWERAALENSLERWAGEKLGHSLAMPGPRVSVLTVLKRHAFATAGWAAAAALAAGWFFHQESNRPGKDVARAEPRSVPAARVRPVSPVKPESGTPVAYLSRASGVVLADRGSMRPGQTLDAGQEFVLTEGLVELDFYSGARVSIEAPARFTPDSDMRLTVKEGKVQVDVPESARGFAMVMPDGQVTDFGTSFGIEVTEKGTSRLQVNRGEIELADQAGKNPKRMNTGEAVAISSAGKPTPISFQPMKIISTLEDRKADENKQGLERWNEVCRSIDKDPSVLVHFRFLNQEDNTRQLINHAASGTASRAGTVIAASWTEGRWPGKAGLAFSRPSDRVRIEVPGEYPAVTYFAWVKADGLPRTYNGLFLSECEIGGEAHWQFSNDGRFMFGVRPVKPFDGMAFRRAFSDPVISGGDLGTWIQLATTYDASRRSVTHYMNGELVHQTQIAEEVPIRFGRATLGNFFDPNPEDHAKIPGLGENWSYRNWTGVVDEFILYSRALDSDEILKLYEAGKPD